MREERKGDENGLPALGWMVSSKGERVGGKQVYPRHSRDPGQRAAYGEGGPCFSEACGDLSEDGG